MAPRTIHLRERQDVAATPAEVIDAKFTVVAARRLGWLRPALAFLLALAGAAAIGFLVPPAWMVLQNLADLFR